MWVVESSGMVPWSNMVSDFRETPDFRDNVWEYREDYPAIS
jgi:hypothetical protein